MTNYSELNKIPTKTLNWAERNVVNHADAHADANLANLANHANLADAHADVNLEDVNLADVNLVNLADAANHPRDANPANPANPADAANHPRDANPANHPRDVENLL